jgi:Outer membrane protein beta-barrel domain
MKKILFAVFTMTCFYSVAQNIDNAQMQKIAKEYKMHYGIKAGYNFAKITGSTPDFHPKSNNGFMVAGFMAPPAKGGFGFRSEIVYSRQGFSFDASGKISNVSQDYIYMPQLTTFTIAKKLQLQAGAQIGYLLNSKQSSSGSASTDVMNYFNRIDYGATAGVEIYPIKQVIIGARYNVSFGNIYKHPETSSTGIPSPFPFDPNEFKGKNAVVQLFIGIKL